MGTVIDFPGPTRAPIDPAKILRAASEVEFETVVVLGHTLDGNLYAASSTADGGEVLWLMDRAKRMIHKYADELEEA